MNVAKAFDWNEVKIQERKEVPYYYLPIDNDQGKKVWYVIIDGRTCLLTLGAYRKRVVTATTDFVIGQKSHSMPHIEEGKAVSLFCPP